MASRRRSPDWLGTSAGQTSSPQRTTPTLPSNRASHVHSVNTSPAHPEIQIATFTKKQVCAPMGAPPSECFHTGSDQSPQSSCLRCRYWQSSLHPPLLSWLAPHTPCTPTFPVSLQYSSSGYSDKRAVTLFSITTWVGCAQNVSKGERSFTVIYGIGMQIRAKRRCLQIFPRIEQSAYSNLQHPWSLEGRGRMSPCATRLRKCGTRRSA